MAIVAIVAIVLVPAAMTTAIVMMVLVPAITHPAVLHEYTGWPARG